MKITWAWASAVAVLAIAASMLSSAVVSKANACRDWGFNGYTQFNQSNGWTLTFDGYGSVLHGEARAVASGGNMTGNLQGGIRANGINIQVNWDAGSTGIYRGAVNSDGFASGTTWDEQHPNSTATWKSDGPLKCFA
jgi:hypothetical protein